MSTNRVLVYLNRPHDPISHLKPLLESIEQQSNELITFFTKLERYHADDEDGQGELCISWWLDVEVDPIPLTTAILPAVLMQLRLRASQLVELADNLEGGCCHEA